MVFGTVEGTLSSMASQQLAYSIGIVFNRTNSKAISRIINPDFEWQLDIQILTVDEYMIRVPKKTFGISKEKNSMTLDQVKQVCDMFGLDS